MVPVIVINQNNYNVWIWQPLLAAEIYWVEHLPWDYGFELHQQGENIEVAFQPLPLAEIMATVKAVHDESDQMQLKEANKKPCPTFGPHPNTKVAGFDFQKELEHLPFKLNLGGVLWDKEHQAKFVDPIYSNQEVFTLHDEDVCNCDQLIHTILMSTNMPVYLPHRTISRQLQGEVHKCLKTWLHPGIIRSSNSPYASQVVIVHKKTGEICLCVD